LLAQVVVPAAGVLLAGILATGYYNYRGTGDALKMPYLVNSEQYEVVPLFIFQSRMPDKTYNHEVFRQYHYEFMMEGYERKRSGFGIPGRNLVLGTHFFWGYVLWAALVFGLGRFTRWGGFALGLSALTVLANAVSSSERLQLHYLAPVVPLFVFLSVAGVRQMRVFRVGGRRIGRPVAEATIAICLLSFTAACMLRAHYGPHYPGRLGRYRPLIASQLQAADGNDLVVVVYGPTHKAHEEWVYNGADLEAAPIVWARDMGSEKNRRLLEYYGDRHIWRLYADVSPPRLEPYEEER
jgi:hypothetical protein